MIKKNRNFSHVKHTRWLTTQGTKYQGTFYLKKKKKNKTKMSFIINKKKTDKLHGYYLN